MANAPQLEAGRESDAHRADDLRRRDGPHANRHTRGIHARNWPHNESSTRKIAAMVVGCSTPLTPTAPQSSTRN